MRHTTSDSRVRQWRVLLPLGAATLLSLAGDLTLYAVLPAYAEQLAFSLGAVGLMLSANRLVRLGSNPLVGMLLAGSRRRGFVLAGFGLGAVSTLFYVFAANQAVFLAGRLLWGLCWSLIYIGAYCMLLDITDERDRGWGSGILQLFIFGGMAINPLIGGLLSDMLGFRGALAVCAVLSGAGFLLAALLLPETRPDAPRIAFSLPDLLAGITTGWRERLRAARRDLRADNAAAAYLYFATHFISDGILLSTLSLYLQNRYGSSVPLAGWMLPVASTGGAMLALRAGVSALAAPLSGRLSDLARSRWTAMAWGAAFGAGGLLLIAALPYPLTLVFGVAFSAAGAAVVVTVTPALAREINPQQESGAVIGLLANAADLGMALAPLAAYSLVSALSLDAIYVGAAVLLALGIPAAILVHHRRLVPN